MILFPKKYHIPNILEWGKNLSGYLENKCRYFYSFFAICLQLFQEFANSTFMLCHNVDRLKCSAVWAPRMGQCIIQTKSTECRFEFYDGPF